MRRWLVAGFVLLVGKLRPAPRRRLRLERLLPEQPPNPGAELVVLALLGLASLSAVAFVVVYALDRLPHQTQLLGLAIGLAFAALAAAGAVTAKRLVPLEEVSEPYTEPHVAERERVTQLVVEGDDRMTRRRLLGVAAGGAGAAVGVALVVPALSLGPLLDVDAMYRTPWRRGVRLVDEAGRPLLADEIETDAVYTAYPHGVDREQSGAPLVVVRVERGRLDLPAGRRGWAPDGIVAYSKICTHAGCAVSLYRAPLYEPTSTFPALVCPCHYSTFDPARGAAVVFGPAGRPLPQLPLAIDTDRSLVAGGAFSGAVGPSWWGVRMRGRSQ